MTGRKNGIALIRVKKMSDSQPVPIDNSVLCRKAAWSIGLALAGLLCLGPLAAVPAIVLGHLALRSVHMSGGRLRGRGFAIDGILIGYLSIVLQAAVVLWLCRGPIVSFVRLATHSPDYELVMMPEEGASATPDDIAAVQSERLKNLGVPCRVRVVSGQQIRVQLRLGKNFTMEAARAILTKPARLDFRLVHADNRNLVNRLFDGNCAPPPGFRRSFEDTAYVINEAAIPAKERGADIPEALKRFHAPPDTEFLLEKEVRDGKELFLPCFVEKRVQLDRSGIEKARRERDFAGLWNVQISFTKAARKKFAIVTERNVGRQLAIVVDGTLCSAPVIRTPIAGGEAVISGRFTMQETAQLAAMLNAAELPCRVRIVSERGLVTGDREEGVGGKKRSNSE